MVTSRWLFVRYFLEFIMKVDFVFVVLIIIPLVWFKLNGKNDDHDRQHFRILSIIIAFEVGFVVYSVLSIVIVLKAAKSDPLVQASGELGTIYVNQKNDVDSKFLKEFFDGYVRSTEWEDYYDTLRVKVKEKKLVSYKDCLKSLFDHDYTRFYKCKFSVENTTGHLSLHGIVKTTVQNGITFAIVEDWVFVEGELLPLDNRPPAVIEIYYDKTTLTKKNYVTNYSLADYHTEFY